MLTFSTRDDKRICRDLSHAIFASFLSETLKTYEKSGKLILCCIVNIATL